MTPQPRRFSAMSKGISLLVCAVAYGVAAVCAYGVGILFRGAHPVAVVAAADLAATGVIFLWSAVLDNSSVYDPYWSLAPLGIVLFYVCQSPGALDPHQVLVISLVCFWALRLTWNWVLRWRGLGDEDWRYADFRPHRAYWLVSFTGFHLFPTIAVFAGCLPLFPVLLAPSHSFGVLDAAAAVLTAGSILLETEADRELRIFRRQSQSKTGLLASGVWSWSRHPNYVGEVCFWWGIGLFGLSANPHWWWTMIGAVVVTALFVGISVPMMDRHMSGR